MSQQPMTAPTPTTAAELTAEERAAWTIRKAPPTYGEAALLLLRYEATLVALESQLLAARRREEVNEALLCEIAQTAIRAVDSPNFNGPHYRTALRQIVALAATQETR